MPATLRGVVHCDIHYLPDMTQARRTIFLDRDGVINLDKAYVHRWEDFEFAPNAVSAMRRLVQAGYQIVVITNQSGIARGMFSEAQYLALTARIREHLLAEGVPLLDVLHCPHHPQGSVPAYAIDCACRKPAPGLLLEAAQRHGIDLSESVLVGDKPSDIYAGRHAGVRCAYLVKSDNSENVSALDEADAVFDDLHALTHWLLRDGVPATGE